MTLGSFIQDKRIAAGMSRAALGKRLGFLAWTVGQIEGDAWEPHWELAREIAKHLGFSPRAYGALVDRHRPFRDVGAFLAAKRCAAGKSRAEVARALDMAVAHLLKYEGGERPLPWSCVITMAALCAFDPKDVALLTARHIMPYREMNRHTVPAPIPMRSAELAH